MGKWSAILKCGKYVVVNPATKSLGNAVIHPQRTIVGLGKTVKAAAIGSGIGYVSWQALVNDKPVVRTVSDIAIGHDNVDAVVETTHNVVDSVGEVFDSTSSAMGAVAGASRSTGGLNGISDFLRNMTGGGGLDMFGNFFSNIGHGNVSGMSIVGLLLAGLFMFGGFGWFGKIGGALLAMMLIGNNSHVVQQQDGSCQLARAAR